MIIMAVAFIQLSSMYPFLIMNKLIGVGVGNVKDWPFGMEVDLLEDVRLEVAMIILLVLDMT